MENRKNFFSLSLFIGGKKIVTENFANLLLKKFELIFVHKRKENRKTLQAFSHWFFNFPRPKDFLHSITKLKTETFFGKYFCRNWENRLWIAEENSNETNGMKSGKSLKGSSSAHFQLRFLMLKAFSENLAKFI